MNKDKTEHPAGCSVVLPLILQEKLQGEESGVDTQQHDTLPAGEFLTDESRDGKQYHHQQYYRQIQYQRGVDATDSAGQW